MQGSLQPLDDDCVLNFACLDNVQAIFLTNRVRGAGLADSRHSFAEVSERTRRAITNDN